MNGFSLPVMNSSALLGTNCAMGAAAAQVASAMAGVTMLQGQSALRIHSCHGLAARNAVMVGNAFLFRSYSLRCGELRAVARGWAVRAEAGAAESAAGEERKKVVVVGAGWAGLGAAHHLTKQVTILQNIPHHVLLSHHFWSHIVHSFCAWDSSPASRRAIWIAGVRCNPIGGRRSARRACCRMEDPRRPFCGGRHPRYSIIISTFCPSSWN